MERRKIWFLGLILVGLLFVVSCNFSKPTPPQTGKTNLQVKADKPVRGGAVIEGTIADAQTLNPFYATDDASGDVIDLIFNGLVRYNADLEIEGDLAKSWKIEGNTIVFHLRENVKWHDGKPFTADDVIFTYNLMSDPKNEYPYRNSLRYIKKVEKLDDYTIKVTYTKMTANALLLWGMEILPEHILAKEKDLRSSAFNYKPIGTGPFKLANWVEDNRIELVANRDYFEGVPYLEKYIFKIIPNKSIMFLSLQNKEIDLMHLKPDQYEKHAQRKEFQEEFNLFRYPGNSYTFMAFNLEHFLFKDKRVRKAISMAINTRVLVENVLLNLGRRCTGPFPPQSWAYDKDYPGVAFNPEKARELLKEAGWVDSDHDGVLDKEIDGQKVPFKFELITNNGNKSRELTTIIIQEQLAELGIKVIPKFLEWKTFNADYIDKRNFEALILGWSIPIEPDISNIWKSTSIGTGNNFIGYKNPQVDALLDEAATTLDQEKRKKIYHKIHRLIAEDYPYVFLYSRDNLIAVNKRVRNIKAGKNGIKYIGNLIKWYIPLELQKKSKQ